MAEKLEFHTVQKKGMIMVGLFIGMAIAIVIVIACWLIFDCYDRWLGCTRSRSRLTQ